MGLINNFWTQERRSSSSSAGVLRATPPPARRVDEEPAAAAPAVSVPDALPRPVPVAAPKQPGVANLPAAAPSKRRYERVSDIEFWGPDSRVLSGSNAELGLRVDDQEVAAIVEAGGHLHVVWTGTPEDAAVYELARSKVERKQGSTLLPGREHLATRGLIRALYVAAGVAASEGYTVDRDRHDDEIDAMLVLALQRRASDIHLQVNERDCIVLMRCNGDLVPIWERSRAWGEEMSRALFRRGAADTKQIDFRPKDEQGLTITRVLKVDGHKDTIALNLRFASGPNYPEGWDIILRVLHLGLDQSASSLEELGYAAEQVEGITRAIEEPTGMTILVGATGSGKSTTIKTIAEMIQDHYGGRRLIRSIEDPPEYRMRGVRQSPVVTSDNEEEQRRNFTKALRGAMRKDPDTLIIGEIRDAASANLGQQATQTGHRVLTTLHASSLGDTISRLRHLNMALDVLGSEGFLQAIVRQSLLKTLCPHCSIPFAQGKPRPSIKPGAERRFEALKERVMQQGPVDRVRWEGPGCVECRNTGVGGRTVVAEVMMPDWHMLDLIGKGDFLSLKAYWRAQPALAPESAEWGAGLTMREHAVRKMLDGLVSPTTVEEDVGVIGRERSVAEALEILRTRKVIDDDQHRVAMGRVKVSAHG